LDGKLAFLLCLMMIKASFPFFQITKVHHHSLEVSISSDAHALHLKFLALNLRNPTRYHHLHNLRRPYPKRFFSLYF